MARKITESGAHLSFEDVIEQKEAIDKAISVLYSEDNANYQSQFIGRSRGEVEEERLRRMDESDKTHSLLLLTAIEAKFRLDAEERYRKRYKDALSRKIREIYRTRKTIKLEDHLISVRTEMEPQLKKYYDALRNAFKYRHWLAHGRYWESNIKDIRDGNYDFTNLRLIITNVIFNSEFKEISN
ncbi:TPA: hypothetical protein ACJIWH_003810 [Yersinia enterocolitica]|uniref:hypothetical protein n=1 Tax=Yersinia enterocolitica TaxID=630 RepID=UPI0028B76063|nr:hypothetical protein [Yersinia enterocolitica]HEB2009409.1 hypothetical protein [Yersinia enterocolitica]HEG1706408.1 hypothetical protein [Yersinia enterocolitica]